MLQRQVFQPLKVLAHCKYRIIDANGLHVMLPENKEQ